MSEKRDLQAPGGTLPSFQTQNDSRKQRKKIVWSGHRYVSKEFQYFVKFQPLLAISFWAPDSDVKLIESAR